MSEFNFERFRNKATGSISLVEAYASWKGWTDVNQVPIFPRHFLEKVESLKPMKSRQAAALALAMADTIQYGR